MTLDKDELTRELEAMETIHQTLLPLRTAVRRRVMSWVTDRLASDDERRQALRTVVTSDATESDSPERTESEER